MKKIIFLGDSITFGWPYGREKSWVFYIKQNLSNLEVINKGVPGDTFVDMLKRLNEDVFSEQPDYVMIMGGINDLIQNHSHPKIQKNFIGIIEKLQKENIKVLVGLPTYANDYYLEENIKILRQGISNFCRDKNIPLMNFLKILVNSKTEKIKKDFFLDDIHPNQKGYLEMGKYALLEIKRILNV